MLLYHQVRSTWKYLHVFTFAFVSINIFRLVEKKHNNGINIFINIAKLGPTKLDPLHHQCFKKFCVGILENSGMCLYCTTLASIWSLCDKVCQWLATGRWFSPGVPVSSNRTDRHDITEILLKIALSTINSNPQIDSKIYKRMH